MKSLSKLALCLLLAMSLTVSAFAAQVPDSLVRRLFHEEADPHDVYGPFYRRYYHRRSFRLCCGNPR